MQFFYRMLMKAKFPPIDKLATCTEHFAHQISNSIENGDKILITGGGAYNEYLVERLDKLSDNTWHCSSG